MNLWQFMLQNHTEVLELTLEHLWLVGVSIFLAVLIGIPLGILITRWPILNKPVLGSANIIQTIPSLALFGFLLPAPWIGARADRLAILALTLYALLPLIRNTYVGIQRRRPLCNRGGTRHGHDRSATALQVQLPLALGVIIAGVRVATVISIGLATIAAAIGAGGLGEYIFRGLAMVNNQVILAGAIPAALMALLADVSLGWLEKRLSPRDTWNLATITLIDDRHQKARLFGRLLSQMLRPASTCSFARLNHHSRATLYRLRARRAKIASSLARKTSPNN